MIFFPIGLNGGRCIFRLLVLDSYLLCPVNPGSMRPTPYHHVMVRGIERTTLFRDDTDRTDFVARLAALAEQGALRVYAWALLPNHAHLLVRTGHRALPRSMRSLLTGYAEAFNRRQKRGAIPSRTGTRPSGGRRSATSWRSPGVFPAAVYKAARRRATQASVWQRLLGKRSQEA